MKGFFSNLIRNFNQDDSNKNQNSIELNQKFNNKEKIFSTKIPIFLRKYFLHEKKEYKSPRSRPYSSLTKRNSESEKNFNLKNNKSKNSFLINKYCMNELGEPSKYENFLFSANDEIIE